jgi:hypothetical protein
MSTSGDPTKRHQGFLASRIPDELIDQALAVNESLKPDPNADPITQIDQAWIQESARYAGMDSAGVIKAPNRRRLIRLMTAVGLVILATGALTFRLGQVGLCMITLFLVFFFMLLLLALRQANKYQAAAAAYRERRAAALVSLGRAGEAAAPLPVVDGPFWAGRGVMRLDETLKRLHDEYAFSTVNSEDYRQSQLGLLNSVPAHERPFYEQLNALEHAWAVERRELVVKRSGRSRWRVPPTAARAKQNAMSSSLVLLVITAIMAVKGISLIFILVAVLMAVLLLASTRSAHQRSIRYERAEAAYLQRRDDLLAQRRLDERFG